MTLKSLMLTSALVFTGLSMTVGGDARAATAPSITWGYAYDAGLWENFASVTQTPDGGYAGVGSKYLIRLNAAGQVLWAIQLGAELSSIKKTVDGGFVVSGYTGNNAFLAKTDSLGNLLWQKQYSKGSRASANAVQATWDGGYIVSGYASMGGST